VPFDEIAPIVDRSPEAARQLASRARRKVRGEQTASDADPRTQREVIDAFVAASREGDFQALLEVLDPDVVLRADTGEFTLVRGAETVARRARGFAQIGLEFRHALVNGSAGMVSLRDGEPFSVGAVVVRNGRIVAMDILADPERLRRLDLSAHVP
jgi:hypothetical protein